MSDVRAEAAALLRRIEAGTLHRERVRLAAYLGDAAARKALADDALPSSDDLEAWLNGLFPFARDFLEIIDLYGWAAFCAIRFIEWPTEAEAGLARDILAAAEDALTNEDFGEAKLDRASELYEATLELDEDGEHLLTQLLQSIGGFHDACESAAQNPGEEAIPAILDAAAVLGDAYVRQAITDTLIPWAKLDGPGPEPEPEPPPLDLNWDAIGPAE